MIEQISFILNKEVISTGINPALPLLDFIRKEMHLYGTKEVCKEGDCGACSVMVGELKDGEVVYKTVTSCIYPIGNVNGKHVVTIEGLNSGDLIPQQEAFVEEGASQCGFCTPGFIISTTNYLVNNKTYRLEDGINSIAGNICRCTGYSSISRAIENLINKLNEKSEGNSVKSLIAQNVIPKYFANIQTQLREINSSGTLNGFDQKVFVGGGSDLLVQMPDRLLEKNISLVSKEHINFIEEEDDKIIVGAGTTFEEFKNSSIIKKYFPKINNQLNLVASLPIRNMATIGGNIVNASPIGDFTIILLALNSNIELRSSVTGISRELSLSDFYLGYKKLNKQPDELVEKIWFVKPGGEFYFNFEKVSKRTFLDIASVNTAIYINIENEIVKYCFVSAGGVAPVPKYLEQSSEFLRGKKITLETVFDTLKIVQNEISPISDVRGSAEYKRLLLSQLIKAHFIELFPGKISLEALI